MEQQIARIALSGVPYSADKLYSYLVPPELADACRAGVRVSVPFGRGNRRAEGFVLETLCEAADKPLKPVFTVLDKQPLLDASLLRLAKWMKARYFCTVSPFFTFIAISSSPPYTTSGARDRIFM